MKLFLKPKLKSNNLLLNRSPSVVVCKGKGGERCCQLGTCLLEGEDSLTNDPLGITHVHVLTPAEELKNGGRENSNDDDVPVSVFGHRIPRLANKGKKKAGGGHFQLPWTKSAV